MKMRNAILAACASLLALAQADVARAHYGAASESKSRVRIADVGPKPLIVVAFKMPEDESPRPGDRVKTGKKNGARRIKHNAASPHATSSSIFDRWGNMKNKK